MTDWADEEAMRLITTTVTPQDFGVSADIAPLASALRAAHRKGKVEGLREAGEVVAEQTGRAVYCENRLRLDFDRGGIVHLNSVANALNARASELEAETTPLKPSST